MGKNKDLKYRAVCPKCGKVYDTRNGISWGGILICPDCHRSIPFVTYPEIKKFHKI